LTVSLKTKHSMYAFCAYISLSLLH